jgi:M6 family metalloprotease-like protein
MKRFLAIGIAVSLLSLVGVGQANAVTIPAGSVILKSASLKNVSGVQCGKVKGKWIPGTVYKSKYFVSHTQQSKNFTSAAAKAKGKKKTSLLKTATSWKTKATSGLTKCSGSTAPTISTQPATTTTLPMTTTTTSTPPTSTTTTVVTEVSGGTCSGSGVRNTAGTLECRKVAGGGLKWVTVSANPSAPARATGSEAVSNCQLVEPTAGRGNGMMVGFPAITTNLPLTGNLTIGLVPIDFSDAPGTYAPLPEAQIQMDLFSSWIERVSGGRVTVTYRTSSVWSRVQSASTTYGLERSGWGRTLAQEGVAAVDSSFDFSGLSALFFYLPRTVQGVAEGFNQNDGSNEQRLTTNEGDIRFWFGAGKYFYREGYSVFAYLAHEIMHSFGLVDLYVRTWSSADPQPMSGYDIMANQDFGQELSTWSRFLIGWLADNQVYCLRSSAVTSTEITLVPINRSTDGYKSVMVPLTSTRILVLESRRREYFSSQCPLGSDGVIAYVVDTSVGNGMGSNVLQIPTGHELMRPVGTPPIYDAFIRKGESITTGGVTVSVTESGDYDTVRISK